MKCTRKRDSQICTTRCCLTATSQILSLCPGLYAVTYCTFHFLWVQVKGILVQISLLLLLRTCARLLHAQYVRCTGRSQSDTRELEVEITRTEIFKCSDFTHYQYFLDTYILCSGVNKLRWIAWKCRKFSVQIVQCLLTDAICLLIALRTGVCLFIVAKRLILHVW